MKYIVYIALLSIVCSCTARHGEKLEYGISEVFYTSNVTKEQAKKLGDYLEKIGFFKQEKKISVQLDKSVDTFLFRMVTLDSFINDAAYNQIVVTSIPELSQNVFDSKPLAIHLCDDHFKTVKIFRPRG